MTGGSGGSPLLPADSVRRLKLPNGLTVLVRRDPSAPVVAIVTHVKAGYFDETDDVVGIAHVLEHMYFKGTPTRGVGEIARATKAAGGYLNAGTIYDQTSYYTVLPSSAFERGLEIQFDAYANSLIDADELARELEVIIQEAKRKADNPSAVAVESLYALLHDRHRMRRWRIGRETGLRPLTRDDLLRFYRNFYRPGNTILSIVGDVDAKQAAREIERLYGALPDAPVEHAPGPDGAAARGLPLPRADRRHRADAARHRLAHARHARRRHGAPRPRRDGARHRARVAAVSRGARAAARRVHRRLQLHADGDRRLHGPRRGAAVVGGRRGGGGVGAARRDARRRRAPRGARARAPRDRVAVAAPARDDGRAGDLSRRVGSARRLDARRRVSRRTARRERGRCDGGDAAASRPRARGVLVYRPRSAPPVAADGGGAARSSSPTRARSPSWRPRRRPRRRRCSRGARRWSARRRGCACTAPWATCRCSCGGARDRRWCTSASSPRGGASDETEQHRGTHAAHGAHGGEGDGAPPRRADRRGGGAARREHRRVHRRRAARAGPSRCRRVTPRRRWTCSPTSCRSRRSAPARSRRSARWRSPTSRCCATTCTAIRCGCSPRRRSRRTRTASRRAATSRRWRRSTRSSCARGTARACCAARRRSCSSAISIRRPSPRSRRRASRTWRAATPRRSRRRRGRRSR